MAIKILQIDLQNNITPQIGSYDNTGGVTPNNWLNEGGVYNLGPTNGDGRTPYYWFTPTQEVTDFNLCWEDYQDHSQTTAQYHLEIGDSAGNVVLSAFRSNANYYIGPVNVGNLAYQTWHKILIEVRKASASSSTVTAYVDGKKVATGTSDTLLTSAKIALLGHVPGVSHWQNAGQRLRYVTIYDRSYTPKGINLDGMMTIITGFVNRLKGALSTVAFTGSYNDLSNKPTISTVNDGTLTIQQNGTNVQTFTANASANATANIQCVDLTSNQTVAGNKTFSGRGTFSADCIAYNPDSSGTTSGVKLRNSKAEVLSTGNTASDQYITFRDKNDFNFGYIRGAVQSNGVAIKIGANAKDSSDTTINAELQLLAYSNGNKAIFPTTTDTYDLGRSAAQWNNAYIKSLTINGVACGDILTHNASEFADLSSNQTIGGTKTFSGLRTYFGRDISCYSVRKYGKNLNPASNTYQYLNFSGNTVSEGKDNDWSSGYLEQVVDTNGGSRGRWFVQDTSENSVGLEVWASGNDKQVRPLRNGDTDLGTSTRKWKDVNTVLLNGKTPAYNDDVVPRSGGAVITGNTLACQNTLNDFNLCGGTNVNDGARVILCGKDTTNYKGSVCMSPGNGYNFRYNWMHPDGTWTWDGTACQITSDQRLKQQITEIDDKLLDAWEDVNLVQFKYNDAVDTKKDNARLHTGYVVQQIDEACKSHGVDISEYGLYCHEVYPQEVEEAEVEQEDGTKIKERKVIREASEHYSLRYTEALIVECAYLRKCIKELRSEIEQLKSSK